MIQVVMNKNGLIFALHDLNLNQEMLDAAGLSKKELGSVCVDYALFEEENQIFFDDKENIFPLDKIIHNTENADIVEFLKDFNEKKTYLLSKKGFMYRVNSHENEIDLTELNKNGIMCFASFGDMINESAKVLGITKEEADDMITTQLRKLTIGWIGYDFNTMDDFETASESLISKVN